MKFNELYESIITEGNKNLKDLYYLIMDDDEAMRYIEDEYGFTWHPYKDREDPTMRQFLYDNRESSEISDDDAKEIVKKFS